MSLLIFRIYFNLLCVPKFSRAEPRCDLPSSPTPGAAHSLAGTGAPAAAQTTRRCWGYQTTLPSPGQGENSGRRSFSTPVGSLRLSGEATACTRQTRLMGISNGGLCVFKERNEVSGTVIKQASVERGWEVRFRKGAENGWTGGLQADHGGCSMPSLRTCGLMLWGKGGHWRFPKTRRKRWKPSSRKIKMAAVGKIIWRGWD